MSGSFALAGEDCTGLRLPSQIYSDQEKCYTLVIIDLAWGHFKNEIFQSWVVFKANNNVVAYRTDLV